MIALEQQPGDHPDFPHCLTQPCLVPGEHYMKTCLEEEETHIEDNNMIGPDKGQIKVNDSFAKLQPKEPPDRNAYISATTHSKDLIVTKQIVEAKDRTKRKSKRLLTAQKAFKRNIQLSYTL